jgi:hypothetical protein
VRRRTWFALGVIAVLVIVAAVALWLPGPRAAVPGAEGANRSGQASSFRPRTPGLPDPRLTPGSINPHVTQENIATTVCKSGWTATVRPPAAYTNALKVAQILEYGYSDRRLADYEEDHLVPLELGGAPRDPNNLWPEPRQITLQDGTMVGSDAKDGLENYLRRQVCAGSKPLADAQSLIAGDWIAAWEEAGKP